MATSMRGGGGLRACRWDYGHPCEAALVGRRAQDAAGARIVTPGRVLLAVALGGTEIDPRGQGTGIREASVRRGGDRKTLDGQHPRQKTRDHSAGDAPRQVALPARKGYWHGRCSERLQQQRAEHDAACNRAIAKPVHGTMIDRARCRARGVPVFGPTPRDNCEHSGFRATWTPFL